MNPPRPLGKAKYLFTPIAHSTVRERWKEPRKGSEIDPEIFSLQGSGSSQEWPRTYWRMGQRVSGSSKAKAGIAGAVGKPSLNRATSYCHYTRSVMSYTWAGWKSGKPGWRTERVGAAKPSDDLCVGVKSLSSYVIAGSLRNVFRYSQQWRSHRGRALIRLGVSKGITKPC